MSAKLEDPRLVKYAATLRSDASPQLRQTAQHFLEWAGPRPLDLATIHAWVDSMRKEKYADGTIAWRWQVVRRLFLANGIAWPFRRGDAPVIREGGTYRPAMDTELVGEMIRHAKSIKPAYYACFMALSSTYGTRRVEMSGMTPANLRGDLLFVETAKHGRERHHLIPEEIQPWLFRWGFRLTMSDSSLSRIFADLKREVGIDKVAGDELGYHSIRRMLVKSLEGATLPDGRVLPPHMVESFLRWKPQGMMGRYAASQVVGKTGPREGQSLSDEETDRTIFQVHPFLKYWRE